MEYIPQILGSLGTLGVLFWQIRNVDSKVDKMMNNHLVHIAKDITSIKEIAGRHDERISHLEKK